MQGSMLNNILIFKSAFPFSVQNIIYCFTKNIKIILFTL